MTRAPALGPNAYLIGVAGSRNRLDTPALVLDRAALMRNIAKMATTAARHGVGLRRFVALHMRAHSA